MPTPSPATPLPPSDAPTSSLPGPFDPAAMWAEFLADVRKPNASTPAVSQVNRVRALSLDQKLDVLIAGVDAHRATFPPHDPRDGHTLAELNSLNAIERFRYAVEPQDEPALWALGLERRLPESFWNAVLRNAFPGGLVQSLGRMDLDDPLRDPTPLLAGIPPRALVSIVQHLDYASARMDDMPAWLTDPTAPRPDGMTDTAYAELTVDHQRRATLIRTDRETLVKVLDRLPAAQWERLLAVGAGELVLGLPLGNVPSLLAHSAPQHAPTLLLALDVAENRLPPARQAEHPQRRALVEQHLPVEVRANAYQELLRTLGTRDQPRSHHLPPRQEEAVRRRLNDHLVAIQQAFPSLGQHEQDELRAVGPTPSPGSAPVRPKTR